MMKSGCDCCNNMDFTRWGLKITNNGSPGSFQATIEDNTTSIYFHLAHPFKYCPECGIKLEDKLLPCPLCGGSDLNIYSIGSVDHIKCNACCLDMVAYTEQGDTLSKKWNKRVKTSE